jgi:hypothetical protein
MSGDPGNKKDDEPVDQRVAPQYAEVRLSYSQDPEEQEAYFAYQECMLEQERRAAENTTEQDKRFNAQLAGLNFKTPSPDSRAPSAFVPLTQVPPPPPPRYSFSAAANNSGGRNVVPAGQMDAILNPYGHLSDHYDDSYVSGRRSAPPMLPSPPCDNRNSVPPNAVAPKVAPRNNHLTARSVNANGRKKPGRKPADPTAAKKPAAKKTARTSGILPTVGAGGGKMHYREDELECLMDIMEDVLPIGKFEKEKVAERYNELNPTRPREYQNLMSQFNKFASKKPPTGDPDCPPLVRKAKLICKKIKGKAQLGVHIDEDEDDDDADDDDDVDDMLANNAAKKTKTGGSERDNAETKKAVVPGAPRSSKKSKKEDVAKSLVEIFMHTEAAATKRIEMAAKRQHDERQQMLTLGLGALQAFASMFTGTPMDTSRLLAGVAGPPPSATRLTPESDDGSSNSDSALSVVKVDMYDKDGKKRPFNDRVADWKTGHDAQLGREFW